jgi:hypothetical protein
MTKLLGWLGWVLVALAVAAGYWFMNLRADPMGRVAGRTLEGEVIAEPITDWSFAATEPLIAVETRPASPHSVTTTQIVLDGALYVPALAASSKSWTHYAVSDPRVRVKVGDRIYPGIATRIEDPAVRARAFGALRARMGAPPANAPAPTDVWLFRIDSARGGAQSVADAASPAMPEGVAPQAGSDATTDAAATPEPSPPGVLSDGSGPVPVSEASVPEAAPAPEPVGPAPDPDAGTDPTPGGA